MKKEKILRHKSTSQHDANYNFDALTQLGRRGRRCRPGIQRDGVWVCFLSQTVLG